MKRNAFTMIELIFVIVILGILASVAIPKLAATRDDAENVKVAHSIMTGASEIASYAIAQGKTEDNLSVMSNMLSGLIANGEASEPSLHHLNVKAGTISDCIRMAVDVTGGTEVLSLSYGSASGDSKCLNLQRIIDVNDYPMVLRGIKVEY